MSTDSILSIERDTVEASADEWEYQSLSDATRNPPKPLPATQPQNLIDALSLLRTTLESTNDGVVVVDLSGHIVCYNARFVDMWQIPDALLLGRTERTINACIARQMMDSTRYLKRVEQECFDPRNSSVDVFAARDGRMFERHVAPQRSGRHCVGMVVHWREVTEHSQLRQALSASESSHHSLLESMSDGVFVARDGHFVFANAALPAMLGYTHDEFVGLPFERVMAPEFLEQSHSRLGRTTGIVEPPANSYRIRFLKKNPQDAVWFELHANPLVYEGHDCVLGMVRDVTERLRSEQREQLRDDVLERLARGADLDGVLQSIVFGTEAILPHTRCAILVVGPRGSRLQLGVAPSLPDFLVGALDGLDLGQTARSCGLATQPGERLVMEDIATGPFAPVFAKLFARASLVSSWSQAVLDASGKLTGVFVAYNTAAGSPAGTDLELLQQAASLAGLAIERKRAQEELQLASLVYQTSTEAMMVMDRRDRVLAVNPAFVGITGFSANEVLGADAGGFYAVRSDSQFYGNLRQMLETRGQWQGELQCQRKNGESFVGWFTINTFLDANGAVLRRVVLFSDITNRKQSEAMIWRQANFDMLTQLPNRNMLQDRLSQEIRKAAHEGRKLALLSIDLDHFKEVNGGLGYNKGDQVLIEAARRIGQCVGAADSVARMGGDEFVAMVSSMEGVEQVGTLARRLLEQLALPYELGASQTVVNASIGLAVYPHDASTVEALLTSATEAMRVAKSHGGNQSSFFTPALQEAAQKRNRLVSDLRRAVAEQQFTLHFQPITDLRTGQVRKAEALVRWQHPERGLVSPAEFIPVAEETGLIKEIGDFVFKEAATLAKRWREQYNPEFQVSVNKSPIEFNEGGTPASARVDFLKSLGLPGNAISIEITEGLLLNSEPHVDAAMKVYRDAGIQLAIDDFGTGYSALSYLKKFNIDYLKIDQSFTRNLASDTSDLALCEAIVVMAHRLGLKVVAEGVETEAQRDLLVGMGCDYGQGYLFARPVGAEDFELLLLGDKL